MYHGKRARFPRQRVAFDASSIQSSMSGVLLSDKHLAGVRFLTNVHSLAQMRFLALQVCSSSWPEWQPYQRSGYLLSVRMDEERGTKR